MNLPQIVISTSWAERHPLLVGLMFIVVGLLVAWYTRRNDGGER